MEIQKADYMSFYQNLTTVIAYSQFDAIPNKGEFIKNLRERHYPIKYSNTNEDVNFSRLINEWIEYGLIDSAVRDSKGAWKRFSIVDLIWIKIISKLRYFGISTKMLEIATQCLLTNRFDTKSDRFEFSIWGVLQKLPISLILLPTGITHLAFEETVQENKDLLQIDDYLHLSFNLVVSEILDDSSLLFTPIKLTPVSDNELNMLHLLRNGNYSQIEIVPEHGEIQRYSVTERLNADKRIGEIINDKQNGFEEIKIQKTDGQVVSIKRTITKKVK